jgi:crotonobetainyl-CoA:carnitine CoA-transferase CaiB-like acyl-CoA transferase
VSGVLDGLRVLDVSAGLAGPVATQILAEAGADVVKVERPGGDPLREYHPSGFATWNRSKRSVVLDFDSADDLASLHGLLGEVDVFVHDLRPATAARFGLADDALRASHPRLIVCAITGYPADHPDVERPGYDLLVQARSGLMDYQAGWRPGPIAWRFFVPSWFAAALALTGIAARLFHRERTGAGGCVHTSLMQGVRLAENMVWSRAEHPPPSMAGGPSPVMRMPQVAQYECADGRWLQILNPADRVDLSKLPLTIDALDRLGLTEVEFDGAILGAAMTQFPADQWLEAIRAVDVAVELIAPLGGLLTHEEVVANGYVVDVHDPIWGATRQSGAPFMLDGTPQTRGGAPQLGEHDGQLSSLFAGNGAAASAPLEGVRVIDIGAFLAGPLAPMLLADLGADVVKIEPVTGDPLRGWRDEFYIASNRGKRGTAIDISSPAGAEVLRRLIARADVMHHNMRTGASVKLGIDAESLHALNPTLILSHVSAYGPAGERANWPGYDSVFQAMSGWAIELAGQGKPPLFNHLGNMDTLTGTFSTAATILALYHRQRTGEVITPRCSLLNTATVTTGETLVRTDEGDELAPFPHLDEEQTGLAPWYRIYRAADGWIAVAALGEERRAALLRAADVDDVGALEAIIAGRGAADVLAALATAGVPAELVEEQQYFAVFDDPDNLRTRQVASYPQADWGEMQQFGAFWYLGDLQLHLDRACPSVGQHTTEVLRELGYEQEAIAALAASGLVAIADAKAETEAERV